MNHVKKYCFSGHRRVEKSAATFVKDYIRKRNLILSLIVSIAVLYLWQLQKYSHLV